MRPWHHQAANSRVFFNAHKCKVPSFMLVKTIRMSFVPMMKPRVYSLFCIVVAYFFIPSCRIIPCLILSSLPLSQLSGHLLCSPISSPWFPFLYSFFYTLLPPLYYYPYATLIPVVSAYSSSMAYREDMRFHELSMRCFGEKWRWNQLENKEHWIKTEAKFNYVYFNFLTCSAISCILSLYVCYQSIKT